MKEIYQLSRTCVAVVDESEVHSFRPCVSILSDIVKRAEQIGVVNRYCIIRTPSHQSWCQIPKDSIFVNVYLQTTCDPRYFFHHFAHEICHAVLSGIRQGNLIENFYAEWMAEIFAHDVLIDVKRVMKESRDFVILQLLEEYITEQHHEVDHLLDTLNNRGVRELLPLHFVPKENYDQPQALALFVLPLFVENPNLYKIFPRIAQMSRDTPFEKLMQTLLLTADDSYRNSFEKMIRMLFP